MTYPTLALLAACLAAAVCLPATAQTPSSQPLPVPSAAIRATELPQDRGDKIMPPMPPLKPLLEMPLRDTSVTLAPDGFYYLTGTTGAPTWWTTNEGIRMWKSRDLKTWQPMGFVWTFDKDATWQKRFDAGGRRALWAPEIYYTHGTFWLAYSMNYDTGGTGLLKSTSGKAEGPYVDVKTDGPITSGIDASLFEDDDGTVYYVWQEGRIAKMNAEMTDIEGPTHILPPTNFIHVGFEGAFLFKANGKYYLSCADVTGPAGHDQRYDGYVAVSDHLMGPYGPRYIASVSGGHNTYFKDEQGQWWCTFFGSDELTKVRERAAIFRVHFAPDGRVMPGAGPTK